MTVIPFDHQRVEDTSTYADGEGEEFLHLCTCVLYL